MSIIASVLALAATGFGVTAPSAATRTVYADLNGDGLRDYVTVRTVPGKPDEQLLSARVGARQLTATVPLASPSGVLPMRITDLDTNGRDEVVVTESLGANTLSFGVWGLYDGDLAPVTLVDGTPLRLWEGGGISAISRYGCGIDHDGRSLTQTGGVAVDVGFTIYEGERVTYVVDGSLATETWRSPVRGPRDDPAFQVNPADCG
ncbi:MAG: hypothetical protein WBA97_18475 [Actinophytocola sp.]|uniref:hypothetical protein n=1 Tax=Actinophytocola sp. TaxID=1872138 RepID=UPI003C749081